MGMLQLSNDTCFIKKALQGVLRELHMQHLDGILRLEIQVLAQIDISKGSSAYPTNETIVPHNLPHTLFWFTIDYCFKFIHLYHNLQDSLCYFLCSIEKVKNYRIEAT